MAVDTSFERSTACQLIAALNMAAHTGPTEWALGLEGLLLQA
jgi:predicted protein tyrosine phosphatase